jgi:ABC-type multidrug transport system fused ATPase/permease subunit
MKQLIENIWFLLGNKRKVVPVLIAIFVLQSLIELIGIAMIGQYIALLLNKEGIKTSPLGEWSLLFPAGNSRKETVYFYSLLLITIFVLKTIVSIAVYRTIYRFSWNQVVHVRDRLMSTYQALPYEVYVQRNSSEYIQSTQIYANQYATALGLFLNIIGQGVIALGLLIFMFFIHPLILTGVILLLTSIAITYDKVFRKKIATAGAKANLHNTLMITSLREGVRGIKEIRILGFGGYFRQKVRDHSAVFATHQSFRELVGASSRYIVETGIVFAIVCMVAVAYKINTETTNLIPLMGMFGAATLRLNPIANLITRSASQLRFVKPGIESVARDLRLPSSGESLEQPGISFQTPQILFEELKLSKIEYSYPGSEISAIRGLDLDIVAGEAIGVKGPSGSGKTTLIDIVLGLLVPQSGEISFNGQPLHNNVRLWQRHCAYLPQEVFLTDATIRENIALGVETDKIDDNQITSSIEDAQLGDVMQRLPQGLYTEIGENGVRLSGGERQRVALARAFYHDRTVLILDEATSALDSNTESEIISVMNQLKRRKTLIVISHSVAMLNVCDRIIEIA